jgi:hypothetical protein
LDFSKAPFVYAKAEARELQMMPGEQAGQCWGQYGNSFGSSKRRSIESGKDGGQQ